MTDVLLPAVAALLMCVAGWALSGRVLHAFVGWWERPLLAALLALGVPTVATTLLSEAGLFSRASILLTLVVFATGACVIGRKRLQAQAPFAWPVEVVPPLLVAACALAIAAVAAWMLPVWQWDSLGYHLPFVNFVLQNGTRADVPELIPYISTYPHGIETLFLILRALLPNDHLVDIGQIPLGIIGSLAIAGICERLGGRPAHGLAAGALWLTLPGVFMQLPTNYVDVGAATYFLMAVYWLLSPPVREQAVRAYLLAAVALGLYLGAKPSAPLPTLILSVVLAVRLWRIGRPRAIAIAAALVLLLGAESYVRNFIATGNPLWPIAVELGPIKFAGERTIEKLVAAGAAAPRPHGNLLERVLESWTTLHGPPAFDMRLGGFGPVILLLALPATLVTLVRRARTIDRANVRWWAIAVLASIAHPEPSTARFVLAFPALLLACAAAGLASASRAVAAAALAAGAGLAGWALVRATPGFTPGDDFSPFVVHQAKRAAFARTIGPDGPPGPWLDFTGTLTTEHVVAYDESFTLPGLLWNRALTNQVLALRWGMDRTSLQALLARKRVTHLVAGRDLPAGSLVRSRPHEFERLFPCGSDPCEVYRVRSSAP